MVDAPEPLAEPAPGSGQDRASGQASRARPAAARSCLTASAKAPGAGTGAEEQPRERGVARPVARPPAGPGAHPSHGTPRQASLLAPPVCGHHRVCVFVCRGRCERPQGTAFPCGDARPTPGPERGPGTNGQLDATLLERAQRTRSPELRQRHSPSGDTGAAP